MLQINLEDPDGTLSMLRDSVATLAARTSGAESVRTKRACGTDVDSSLWKSMAEAGWTSLLLPEELGGAGLDLPEQVVLSEALGRHLISEPLSSSAVLVASLLAQSPATPERQRLADALIGGDIVAVAYLDPAAHSKGHPLRSTTTSNGLTLSGEKRLVEAAASASDFLVVATVDDGAALVSMPANAAGLTIEALRGVDGAMLHTLRFDQVKIDTANILARAETVDALLAEPTRRARVALSAELAGLACQVVETTIAFTKDRVQFGKAIGSFQALQHRMVEMYSDAEFACASVVNAVECQAEPEDKAARLSILATKARTGDAATSICRRAVHLHGAMGFTDECQIGLYLKRAIALNATLGQPEQLRLEFVELEMAA